MSARILVADDEESILDLLSRFLEKQGYQVDVANSVDTALALLRENRYDVVLTDKNMPDLSGRTEGGMEIVRFVREQMPESEVIMITGYATIETAVEAMKLGAFDYIMKPIPLNELKEKIERILEYRRFINAGDTLEIYRTLYNQVLSVLENRDDIPDEQVERLLRSLGRKIDNVFGMQKEYETIIQAQAEAMEKIEEYSRVLADALPPDSPYQDLLTRILVESRKRV
jgi:DNA-binding response OmpR family regulator